jgi:hypothetical protein
MTGVELRFGSLYILIGPQDKGTPIYEGLGLTDKTIALLDMIGINPYAVRCLIAEFMKSKLIKKGLHVTVEDVRVLIGPQRDPLIVRFDG